MREIGGYIEFESFSGSEYYADSLAVANGRTAAVLLIRMRKYKKIYIPDFMCSSLREALERYQIAYSTYPVNRAFMPDLDVPIRDDEAVYIVNYYGQLRSRIAHFKEKWHNIIIDNTQDFFFCPPEADCVCSCRKYFGVPDGGYVSLSEDCDTSMYQALDYDVSDNRMGYLLGRFEHSASEFYQASVENNKTVGQLPLLKMSGLTQNLLRGIDYAAVSRKRKQNFSILHESLCEVNELRELSVPDGAFMYPLLVPDGAELRQWLQKRKIYVPKLWPNIVSGEDAAFLAENIVPLPCDQRYSAEDMQYIIESIRLKKG